MAAAIDPNSYTRLPKLDVRGALSLAKMLLHRVPKASPPGVRRAASAVEQALAELKTKWRHQRVPRSRKDIRPLARRLNAAWNALRDRLVTYQALPEGDEDLVSAMAIHDLLLPDGLEFLKLSSARQHAESERGIELIDERELDEEIDRLVGERFLPLLRETHQAYGDALGISKAVPLPAAAILVVEPLRALTEAIGRYALQLVVLAHNDPEKHDAVVGALSPIDEFRAQAGRRVSGDGDADDDDVEDDVVDTLVSPVPANAPVVLAPVA
jgi:hypothetical protein